MTRLVGRLIVAAYGVGIVVALLWPDGWSVNRLFVAVYVVGNRVGIPLSPDGWSAVANVVAFIPLAYGLVIGWPRVPAWAWAAALVALSCLAETAQLYLARDASVVDVALNTAGVIIGTLLGVWQRRRRPSDGRE